MNNSTHMPNAKSLAMTGENINSNVDISGRVIGKRTVAMVAFLLGLQIMFVVGLAQSEGLHNAAHDVRHSLAFPCH